MTWGWLSNLPGGTPLYGPYGDVLPGQGMASLSLFQTEWNLFVLKVYTTYDYDPIALLQLLINGLTQDDMHFLLFPKQGNKIEAPGIEDIVLNRVGFQTLSGSSIPNIGRVPLPRVNLGSP